jgi:hypothetical protein
MQKGVLKTLGDNFLAHFRVCDYIYIAMPPEEVMLWKPQGETF